MDQTIFTDTQHEPLKLITIFDNYSKEKVGHFQPSIDSNPHAVIETLLRELHRNKGFQELFSLLSTQKFENTCRQCSYAFALLLKLQAFAAVFLLDSYEVEAPEKNNITITKKAPEQKFSNKGLQHNPHCLLGIEINEVEYLLSPKHFRMQQDTLHSTFESEAHLFKSSIYLKRFINDKLREKNPCWDMVAYPLWLKSENIPKYYKVFSRTPVVIE